MTWWEVGEDEGMKQETKSRVRYCQYFLLSDAALKMDEWVWFHSAAVGGVDLRLHLCKPRRKSGFVSLQLNQAVVSVCGFISV